LGKEFVLCGVHIQQQPSGQFANVTLRSTLWQKMQNTADVVRNQERSYFGPNSIVEAEENVAKVRENLKIAQSRQKSYAD
jgi:hypothetical protein